MSAFHQRLQSVIDAAGGRHAAWMTRSDAQSYDFCANEKCLCPQ